jgi:hypothetical protein
MGFALEENGGVAPAHPHIFCAGDENLKGRGWAWHDHPNYRDCYSTDAVAAAAPLVAAAIDGRELPGVDRLLAIARLKKEVVAGYMRIFQNPCKACGSNHRERADRAIRVVQQYIHPGAVATLRAARVPEGNLREPRFLRHGCQVEEDEKSRKRKARCLPVWLGDPDKSRAAQILFAIRYASSCGILLPPGTGTDVPENLDGFDVL